MTIIIIILVIAVIIIVIVITLIIIISSGDLTGDRQAATLSPSLPGAQAGQGWVGLGKSGGNLGHNFDQNRFCWQTPPH